MSTEAESSISNAAGGSGSNPSTFENPGIGEDLNQAYETVDKGPEPATPADEGELREDLSKALNNEAPSSSVDHFSEAQRHYSQMREAVIKDGDYATAEAINRL